jgi:hypothetical protein
VIDAGSPKVVILPTTTSGRSLDPAFAPMQPNPAPLANFIA